MPKFVLLWTDAAVWALAAALLLYVRHVLRQPMLAARWRGVFTSSSVMASAVVLAVCGVVTLLDSVHYRLPLPPAPGQPAGTVAYEARTRSVLDAVLWQLAESRETSYSVPLATHGFAKESVEVGGRTERVAPRLQHGGVHLADPSRDWAADVVWRVVAGVFLGVGGAGLVIALVLALLSRGQATPWREAAARAWRGEGAAWRAGAFTLLALGALVGPAALLGGAYHVLGTDQTGNDVLYQALKSIRTAFVIGSLATLATLPLAVGLGLVAGYFRGWVDDVVQYVYTVLSSVPNVLLIAACVLMVQVFLDQHPELFETGAERADVKLFLLCTVLGLTGWAGLARLVRAETLKQRELDYVRAARAYGAGDGRLMVKHIFPNLAHLMLIVTVLEFSALVLYEAVLSYVGVGVDPSMNSFGGMINLARSEMSRDPMVWWSFASAFGFMLAIVLAANLLADGVQKAFDPRGQGGSAA